MLPFMNIYHVLCLFVPYFQNNPHSFEKSPVIPKLRHGSLHVIWVHFHAVYYNCHHNNTHLHLYLLYIFFYTDAFWSSRPGLSSTNVLTQQCHNFHPSILWWHTKYSILLPALKFINTKPKNFKHHYHHLQGLGLLTRCSLWVSWIDPFISSVVDLFFL